jgi:hypothetical protein
MRYKTLITVFLVIALLGLYTSKVSAQVASGSGLRQQKVEARIGTVKTKAEEEIDRRVTSINTIITRINAMKRLSDSQKSGFVAQANQLLTELSTLKGKIDADTDTATLKTDRLSIYNSYRVYMLFMPQMNILSAADRITEITAQALGVIPTIQGKITQLQNSGKDVAALNTAMTDLQNKLSDANTQTQNAVNAVSGLAPDQGNAATLQANNSAITGARNDIKAAITDLKAARTDIKTIRTGIKSLSPKVTITPTP